ncbi:hypothetical protein ACN4EG_09975 [Alkalinema pantanalense CENA528]
MENVNKTSTTTRPRPKSSSNFPNFWILFGTGLAIALLIYWLKR